MTTRTLYGDPMQALNTAVYRFDRRKKTQQTLLWLPRGLMIALLIGVGLAVAARVRPLLTNSQIAMLAAGVLVAAVLICLGVVWGRQKSAIALAQRFDIDFDLQERVSTAMELNAGRIDAPEWLAAEQISDAEATTSAALAMMNSRLPLTVVRRDWAMVVLLAIAFALLLLLPNPQAEALSRNAAVDAAIAEAADTLEDVAEDVASDPSLDAAERQSLLEDLRQRIEGLQNQEISPEEAFASLSEASAELQDRADQLGSRSSASQTALQQAAEALRNAGFGSEEGGETGEPLEQATEGLQEIAERANQMTESERQQAAAALRDASQSMQNSQMSQSQQQASESLQNAAESLENDDLQAAQEQLQQAQQQLQQSANEAQRQQQSQQTLSEAAQQAREAASQVSEAQQQQQQSSEAQQGQESSEAQEGERGSPQQSDQSAQQQNGQQTTGEGSQQSPEGQLSQMGSASRESEGGQSDQGSPSDSNPSRANAGDAQGSDGSDQPLQAAGEQQQVSQDNNADGQGERDFEPVNVPRRIGGQFGNDAITLESDPSDSPVQEGNFSQNPDGQVSVPYNEVFGSYRDAANRALDSGYVPLALRDVVRDYFTSLEPGR